MKPFLLDTNVLDRAGMAKPCSPCGSDKNGLSREGGGRIPDVPHHGDRVPSHIFESGVYSSRGDSAGEALALLQRIRASGALSGPMIWLTEAAFERPAGHDLPPGDGRVSAGFGDLPRRDLADPRAGELRRYWGMPGTVWSW